jgi:hypothetical protein
MGGFLEEQLQTFNLQTPLMLKEFKEVIIEYNRSMVIHNELLKMDIALREREYAIKLFELEKMGIKEGQIDSTVQRLRRKGL